MATSSLRWIEASYGQIRAGCSSFSALLPGGGELDAKTTWSVSGTPSSISDLDVTNPIGVCWKLETLLLPSCDPRQSGRAGTIDVIKINSQEEQGNEELDGSPPSCYSSKCPKSPSLNHFQEGRPNSTLIVLTMLSN